MGAVFAAILCLMVGVFSTLIWLGFRNGDRDDDAHTTVVTFARLGSPEHERPPRATLAGGTPAHETSANQTGADETPSPAHGSWVRIAIANPAETPVLVSWRCIPLGHAPWVASRVLRSRTVMPWRLDEGTFALLGGVDAAASHTWEVPIDLTERARRHCRGIRIEVRIDKDARRVRVQTVDLALAS